MTEYRFLNYIYLVSYLCWFFLIAAMTIFVLNVLIYIHTEALGYFVDKVLRHGVD